MNHSNPDTSVPLPCALVVLLDGDLVQTPEHLGVSYLLAVLRRQGVDCRLFAIEPGREAEALDALERCQPRIVGVSLTTVNLPRAVSLGEQLRHRLGENCHLVVGGPIATFLGDRLLRLPQWSFVDSMVRGEGEQAFAALVERVLADEPPAGIPGVTTRGHEPTFPLVVAVDDLDALPWPARDQLQERHASGGRFPYVRISTSRGCTSRCTFCNAPHAGNNLAKRKGWRGREPEDVVDELAHLMETYGVDTFDFVDSTFEDPGGRALGKGRIRRIAELILERDLHLYYNICSQAKNWHDEDRDLLSLLFRSGLEKVLIGIESGSDRVLKQFRKSSTVEDNHRALGLFRRHGVYVAFGFIMFQPYSQWQDLEDNAAFLQTQMGHNLRRFLTRLELYPGAEIVHQLEADGLLDDDYWETLRPFAYRYADPKIGAMATNVNRLFGSDYLHQGSIGREPSVFQFETFDITLHTYISRLQRQHMDQPGTSELIGDHVALIDGVKDELADYNAALFRRFLDAAPHGGLDGGELSALSEEMEQRYAAAMEHLRSLQLRLGMNLRRQQPRPPHQEVAYG